MKIIICGPPHSGKSCLREGLKQAICSIPGASYPYIITACPNGEGAWFQPTANRSPIDVRRLKDDYKRTLEGFTPEFVKTQAESIKNCKLPLTFIDIGGIIDDKNKEICRHATHAIILFNDYSKIDEWIKFCDELKLKIIAEIYSDYTGKEEMAEVHDGIFKGIVHHLERGEDISERYCVRALTDYILSLTPIYELEEERMTTSYNISMEKFKEETILRLSFGKAANNDQIVRDATMRLNDLKISGGRLIKLNGPASLSVAIVIAHAIMHKFSYVGVYDPKLDKYVITIAHGPEHEIGDLID